MQCYNVSETLSSTFKVNQSLTALCSVMTGQWGSGLKGATLTLSAFNAVYGNIGQILLRVSLFLFGITTTPGWPLSFPLPTGECPLCL